MISLRNSLICWFVGLCMAAVVCGVAGAAAQKHIVLGFVQVSPEGTWRMVNTRSVQAAAEKEGIHLIFRVGSNNYTNQAQEFRELIDMGVDVIALSPAQTDGWSDVLAEAKNAEVPVIILDRAVNVQDQSLYVTHIGSDMVEEGRRAGRWLIDYLKRQGRDQQPVRIAVLEGVKGSTPALHRDQGFREVLAAYPNCTIVQSAPADYIFSKGEETMLGFLKAEAGEIDVVFAHNDEMALGAIEAIKKSGKRPGVDVIVIGVDAIKKAFESIMAGEMNATIECSPLLGPQLMEAVKHITAGEPVSARIVTEERDYDAGNAAEAYPSRVY